MTEEKTDLGEVWETSWPAGMDDRARVLSVVTTAREPRSVDWIAERAGVDADVARSILDGAEDVEQVDGGYQVTEDARHRRQQDRLEAKSEEELRELRSEVVDELESEDGVEERRRRRREYLLEMIDDLLD